ncbi:MULTISPECIES: DUF6194 family protein [Amycolatopsis]|uniref:DUF6194 domain-containing protein n=1 Tax=Amycolatopsis dongchuanensis TaxID=1070866 RepID=A0ABP8VDA6_9PSEU
MGITEIIEFVGGLDGVLTLQPGPGDGSPEISWGDAFFYYAPDGVVPKTQPFATIVTKDYPGDETSRLNRPGAFRVNLFAGKEIFKQWTGHTPPEDAEDVVIAHPVYGRQGWLAVVNPGPRTENTVRDLLRAAHDLARSRWRRNDRRGSGSGE